MTSALVVALLIVATALVWPSTGWRAPSWLRPGGSPKAGDGGPRSTSCTGSEPGMDDGADTCDSPGTPDTADFGPPSALRRWFKRLQLTPARRARHEDDLIRFVESLSAALSAGLPPGDALAVVARSRKAGGGAPTPLDAALPDLLWRARSGEGLAETWRDFARESGSPQLLLLARAWALSEETGSPLAGAATTAARLLRDDRERRGRAATALAGARSTMLILSLLPVAGPLLALFMGLDLMNLYVERPMTWWCLATGIALVVIGRWWVSRLLAAAMRGPELS